MLIGILRGPFGRLVLVGFSLLAVQAAVFADARISGVALQVVLAFVATAAAVGGPEKGMYAAVICGVMYDMAAGSDIGSSALTMGVAALVAGLVAFIRVEQQWWIATIFVGVGAAAGEASVPFMRALTGEELLGVEDLVRTVPIVSLGALLMAPALIPLARWSLAIGRSQWRVPVEADASR